MEQPSFSLSFDSTYDYMMVAEEHENSDDFETDCCLDKAIKYDNAGDYYY